MAIVEDTDCHRCQDRLTMQTFALLALLNGVLSYHQSAAMSGEREAQRRCGRAWRKIRPLAPPSEGSHRRLNRSHRRL